METIMPEGSMYPTIKDHNLNDLWDQSHLGTLTKGVTVEDPWLMQDGLQQVKMPMYDAGGPSFT